MTKTYCDCCGSVIEDNEIWRVTIEQYGSGVPCILSRINFAYDMCAKCAYKVKNSIEQKTDIKEESNAS